MSSNNRRVYNLGMILKTTGGYHLLLVWIKSSGGFSKPLQDVFTSWKQSISAKLPMEKDYFYSTAFESGKTVVLHAISQE